MQLQDSPVSRVISEQLNQELLRIADQTEASRLQQVAKEKPFLEWCLEARLWIDREAFSLEEFPHLAPIYRAVPYDAGELRGFDATVQKAAQMGGSIFFILLDIYLALRFAINVGYYFPDQTTALDFSKIRFLKMVRSNYDLFSLMQDEEGHIDEGSMAIRRLGDSRILFLYMGMNITSGPGAKRTTMRTESMPLDVLTFDEVQGMTQTQMEKVDERLSASTLKIKGRVSTPVWPEADINEFFLRGDQRHFHSDCRCPDGIILTEEWPNCIGDSDGRIFYRCPHCDTEIVNPRQGRYIAHKPQNAPVISWTFGQTVSPRITAAELFKKYQESHDKQSFYNRALGRSYANPSDIPVSLEILKQRAWKDNLSWNTKPKRRMFMGIDHMGALNVVVIKEKLDGRKVRTVHLEWIEGIDAFERTAQLMEEYKIDIAALENEPNYNEAFSFAKAFPYKVFIVEYGAAQLAGEMLRWMDRDKTDPQAVRKTTDEARMQWAVKVDQYKFMSYSLGQITGGFLEMPNPQTRPLVRNIIVKGRSQPCNIAELYCGHLTKVAIVSVKDEKENKYVNKVVKVGTEDPHFAYANMCADVALARAYGTTMFLSEEVETMRRAEEAARVINAIDDPQRVREQVEARLPMITEIRKETCGACQNFKAKADNPNVGLCQGMSFRNMEIGAADVRCDEYSEKGAD
jgi:uncharacterized C2H2 Zn-finger protein